MEDLVKLKKWRERRFMRHIITWLSRDRLIRETKVRMIEHILNALCECELNEKGRQYLIQLKNDINSSQKQSLGTDRNINR
jgi:lipopolysaccharide biosynthesis glycosyltransferase